jgi:hypothetical protein
MFGPFELDPEHEATPLVLALERGGRLEGTVRGATVSSNEGRLIAVSNGWRFVRAAPLDADGRYHIDDLAPGRYQVRPCEPPVASLQALEVQPSSEDLAWDCTVHAGTTTRFDLDLSVEGSVVLVGRFELVGESPSDWRASIVPVEHPTRMIVRPRAQAMLAPDGAFELSLSDPGSYRLEVRAGPLLLTEVVSLYSGRTEWEARLVTGKLQLKAGGLETNAALRYLARRGSAEVTHSVDARTLRSGGTLTITVPAGPARLEKRVGVQTPDLPWSSLDEFEVRPGELLELELP